MQLNSESAQRRAIAEALLEIALFVIRQTSASREVSLSAAATLATLSRSGPCRITEIAEQERISQPTVTAMVMRLEQRGLVERGSDPADGRAVLVSITDAGRELLRRRRQTQVDQLSGLLDALDATEQSAVVTAIGALHRLANSAQVTGAPAA
jgi:DNA-binding MarR family transcriptional regulator